MGARTYPKLTAVGGVTTDAGGPLAIAQQFAATLTLLGDPRRMSPIPVGGASLAGRLLCRVRHGLNLVTSQEHPDSVGQVLEFVSGNGHDLVAEAKPSTDVNLDGLNFAVRTL